MQKLARNADAIRSITWRYYVVSARYSIGPFIIMAMYPLFLRAHGLDQFQINVVMTFLTDVPRGHSATRWAGARQWWSDACCMR